jgi:hypothetical protein
MLGLLLLLSAFITRGNSSTPSSQAMTNSPAIFQVQSETLMVRAFIDGDDTLTIDHARRHNDNISNAPGTWNSSQPTYINDIPYYPQFPNGNRQIGESTEMKLKDPLPDELIELIAGDSKTDYGAVNVSSEKPGIIVIHVAKTYGLPGGARWFDIVVPWRTKPPKP